MMLTSLVLIYIFLVVLSDSFFSPKISNLIGMLLAISIMNNIVISNVSYFYMFREYEDTYATGSEIVSRVHSLDADTKEIVVIGDISNESAIPLTQETKGAFLLIKMFEDDLMYDQKHLISFINNTFNEEYEGISLEKEESLENNNTVLQMGEWPAADSIQIIDDVIVIKLSEKKQENNQ